MKLECLPGLAPRPKWWVTRPSTPRRWQHLPSSMYVVDNMCDNLRPRGARSARGRIGRVASAVHSLVSRPSSADRPSRRLLGKDVPEARGGVGTVAPRWLGVCRRARWPWGRRQRATSEDWPCQYDPYRGRRGWCARSLHVVEWRRQIGAGATRSPLQGILRPGLCPS